MEPQFIENEKQQELNDDLVIYFKSQTFEIENRSLINLFNKLDPNLSYRIQGYSCSKAEGSEESLLSEAEKRAKIVREKLISMGFPGIKLSTIAYDYSSECKVILAKAEQ